MQTTTHINPSLTPLGDEFTQLEPDSITLEEGDLLYALVRLRKPHICIETGTGHAFGTRRIAEALVKNGKLFVLISCDTEPEYVANASRLFMGRPVDIRCTTGLTTLESLCGLKADFIFVDAGNAENRMKELKLIIERDLLSEHGTLVIHDTHKETYKPLVEYVKRHGWDYMIFDTLAGIAVFQHP